MSLASGSKLVKRWIIVEAEETMFAKKTALDQITLPAAVASRFAEVDSFDITTDGECIVLRPVENMAADEVRAKLARLDLDEGDVAAAVGWARANA